MKKISLVIASILLLSCSKNDKNYISITGSIVNSSEKNITIENQGYKKQIPIDANGTFSDTLHLKNTKDLASFEESFYGISVGQKRTFTYLKNGYDIQIFLEDNTFTFKGNGSENTNYIQEKFKIGNEFMNISDYFILEKDDFDKKLTLARTTFDNLLIKYENLDPEFAKAEKENNQQLYTTLTENYEAQNNLKKNTAKGSPSPEFNNYENVQGGTNSLSDFKGKYVYIDVWATWCGPCKQQIPFLQSLEEEYHDKNIEFVSISIDQPNLKDTWKNMISNKNMSGVQLFANGDQSFASAYQISGIPRFILIDPKGNIVEANAPRPSDKNLTTLFNGLGL